MNSDKEEQWKNADQFMKTLDDAGFQMVCSQEIMMSITKQMITRSTTVSSEKIVIRTVLSTENLIKITADIMT